MIHANLEHLNALIGRSLQSKNNPDRIVQILIPYFRVDSPPGSGLDRERAVLCAVVLTTLGEMWTIQVSENWILVPETPSNRSSKSKKKRVR